MSNLLGKLIMFGTIALVYAFFPIVLGFLVLFFLGLNLAHGEAKYPEDYYRKSKGPVTWKKKINPWWWLLNDDDPVYPLPKGYIATPKGTPRPPESGPKIKNDWFKPTWPQWLRLLGWGWRNPTCNFDRYVLGLWDKQDWWARERFSRNPEGWNGKDTMWPLPGESWAIALPFISYEGKTWEFYLGWKPNSEFAIGCFRRNN